MQRPHLGWWPVLWIALSGWTGSALAAETPAPPTQAEPHVLNERSARLNREDQNVVRSGPGDRFSVVAVVPKGSEYVIVAKKDHWYNVRLSETETGWVHASLVEEFDDLSHLEFRPNPRLYSRVGSFVLTGSVGGYSFDRKSNSLAIGGRVGYYLLDFVQVEGGGTWTRVNRPLEVVEDLFNVRLEDEQFHILYYHLNVNVEILPGRQMVPYLTAGTGATVMQGRSEPGFNFGVGTTLYMGKKTALRFELRNYRFTSGDPDTRRGTSNFEFTFGTSLLL